MSWLDNLAETLVTWSGKGFDPNGCQLPAFKPRQENRAALPKKEKKPVDVRDDGLLTDAEMKNWRYYGTGEESDNRIREALKDVRTSKSVEVDFDEMPSDMHGITEREYGEMLAYDPPLRNLKLASDVKRLRKTNTLSDVARILGEKDQLVKHYSSALTKASPTK